MLCYPVAVFLMGQEAAVFAYVMPFLMSTLCGTVIAAVLMGALQKSGGLSYVSGILGDARRHA